MVCVFVLLSALPALAADLAVLQNGFSIRHERREALGTITRLYLDGSPQSGYVDVPSDQIVSIEHDDSLAPQPVVLQPVPTPGNTIDDFVNAAGLKHGIDPDLIQSVIRAESGFNPSAKRCAGTDAINAADRRANGRAKSARSFPECGRRNAIFA